MKAAESNEEIVIDNDLSNSLIPSTDSNNSSLTSYIFSDSDFNTKSFNPTTFINKYNKIVSLNELKSQLLEYNNIIKQSLYDIINNNYQKFINISSKLDGIDDRINIIINILLEYHNDLSILYSILSLNLLNIIEKINEKNNINYKQDILNNVLNIMNDIDLIKNIFTYCFNFSSSLSNLTISSSSSVPLSTSNLITTTSNINTTDININDNNNKMISRRNKMYSSYLSTISSSINYSNLDKILLKELHISSEIESTSSILLQSQLLINKIVHDVEVEIINEEEEGSKLKDLIENGLLKTLNNLKDENIKLITQLKQKNSLLLENYLIKFFNQSLSTILSSTTSSTNQLTTSVSLSSNSSDDTLSKEQERISYISFLHCLRAMINLKEEKKIEEIFKNCVTLPLIKQFLSLSPLDSTSNVTTSSSNSSSSTTTSSTTTTLVSSSTSFSPLQLQQSLKNFLSVLKQPLILNILYENELLVTNNKEIQLDLLLNSIWLPISTYFLNYPNLFSVVSSSFSSFYTLLREFLGDLTNLFDSSSSSLTLSTISSSLPSSSLSYSIMKRFSNNNEIKNFFNKFQISIYYTKISSLHLTRLNKIINLNYKNLLNSSLNDVYINKIDKKLIDKYSIFYYINNDLKEEMKFNSSLFTSLCIEMISLLDNYEDNEDNEDENNTNKSIKDVLFFKLFLFSLKLASKISYCISFLYNLSSFSLFINNNASTNASTKKEEWNQLRKAWINEENEKSSSTSSSTSITTPLLKENILLLIEDLLLFINWIQITFKQFIIKKYNIIKSDFFIQLLLQNNNNSDSSNIDPDSIISSSLSSIINLYFNLLISAYQELTTIVKKDCSVGLAGVKAISGMYRMTNKASPVAPSAYVATFFTPLK